MVFSMEAVDMKRPGGRDVNKFASKEDEHIRSQYAVENFAAAMIEDNEGKKDGKEERRPQQKREVIPDGTKIPADKYSYEILCKLGGGAFGDVYMVKQVETGEHYALKLEENKTSRMNARLKVEAEVLKHARRAQRKQLLTLEDRGKTDSHKFIVMAMVGASLEGVRDKAMGGKLSPSSIVYIAMSMTLALRSLHDLGYIHRDLKLANFCVGAVSNQHKNVFLLDFGMAKRYVDKQFRPLKPRRKKGFVGTAYYCSLAQHLGKDMSRADDLESLAIAILELFCPWALFWKQAKCPSEKVLGYYKYGTIHSHNVRTNKHTTGKERTKVWGSLPIQLRLMIHLCLYTPFQEEPDYEAFMGFQLQYGEEIHADPDAQVDWQFKIDEYGKIKEGRMDPKKKVLPRPTPVKLGGEPEKYDYMTKMARKDVGGDLEAAKIMVEGALDKLPDYERFTTQHPKTVMMRPSIRTEVKSVLDPVGDPSASTQASRPSARNNSKPSSPKPERKGFLNKLKNAFRPSPPSPEKKKPESKKIPRPVSTPTMTTGSMTQSRDEDMSLKQRNMFVSQIEGSESNIGGVQNLAVSRVT